jgi:hypothetical protein
MSKRDAAIDVLQSLLGWGEDRDRVSAADKLLRTENLDAKMADEAVATLEEIMNDMDAKSNDRVNAADKLKTHTAKTRTEHSPGRRLAALTDAELDAIIGVTADSLLQ